MPKPLYNLARLRADIKPFRLHFFTTLRSTNDHAARMRRRGDLFAPALVVAARQTAGRGRGANTWFSAPGSLTVTFVLPVNPTLAPHHVPLAAGLAVRNAAAELTATPDIGLKWPNDVYYGDRKLAGLLCERLDQIDLIGIGLNVNVPPTRIPSSLKNRIVFLQQLRHSQSQIANRFRRAGAARQSQISGPLDLTSTLATLARHIHQTLVRRSETPFPLLLREYDRHHILLGRRVTVYTGHEPPITGTCEGLDDTGRLLVRERRASRSPLHHVIAGHVEFCPGA